MKLNQRVDLANPQASLADRLSALSLWLAVAAAIYVAISILIMVAITFVFRIEMPPEEGAIIAIFWPLAPLYFILNLFFH